MSIYNSTIAASSDDARQDGSTVTLTGANITIDSAARYGGLRFTGVNVLPGATINSAYLTVTVPSASFDDPDVTIWAEDTDDAATFTTGSNNVSGRAATSATVTWSASSIGSGVKVSPDLKTILQEVIDRGGWTSGHDIALIVKGNSSNPFRFNAYDGGGADYATLAIDYTEPGAGGGQPARALHQFRQRRL